MSRDPLGVGGSPEHQVINLETNNQDIGGDVLYALRYDEMTLRIHRNMLTRILRKEFDMKLYEISEVDRGVTVTDGLDDEQQERLGYLLEEWTVVRGAIKFKRENATPADMVNRFHLQVYEGVQDYNRRRDTAKGVEWIEGRVGPAVRLMWDAYRSNEDFYGDEMGDSILKFDGWIHCTSPGYKYWEISGKKPTRFYDELV